MIAVKAAMAPIRAVPQEVFIQCPPTKPIARCLVRFELRSIERKQRGWVVSPAAERPEGWNDLILMKPAVGFMLPSAGVTPAPSEKRKMARTPFCSRVLFPVACVLCHPEPVRLRSGQAPPRDPGSFSTPADAPPTTGQPQCVTLEFPSGVCVIQSPSTPLRTGSAKNPGSFFVLFCPAAAGSDTSPVALRERRPAASRPVGEGSANQPQHPPSSARMLRHVAVGPSSFPRNPTWQQVRQRHERARDRGRLFRIFR